MNKKKALSFVIQLSVTLLLFFIIFNQIDFRDKIVLVSGQKIQGEILEKTVTNVRIKVSDQIQTISLEKIAKDAKTQEFQINFGLFHIIKNVNIIIFFVFFFSLPPQFTTYLSTFSLAFTGTRYPF